jgi:hypothetical protein
MAQEPEPVERFAAAWQRGERPDLAAHLPEGEGRWTVLLQLIHIDLEHRLKAGEQARIESYLERFPELNADRPALLELIAAEYELRRRTEPGLSVGEYLQRFPQPGAALAPLLAAFGSGPSCPTVDSPAPPAPALDLAPLPLVPGYEILDEVGRGGMGMVYRARQVALNRLVALKLMRDGAHATAEERARFKREAEAVARLQHPHVVQIFEVGEAEGVPFFAMEFCSGGSLDKRLGGRPLPPRDAAALVEAMARAVHAVHLARVVHRDLKPANILFGADGRLKVTDFGLAKKLDEAGQTQTGAVLGTPAYMAPEQAGGQGKEVGPATDVWALGALLYEALTGRAPFQGATIVEVLERVRTLDPVPPRRLVAGVPRDLETVCLKCLRKDPARRYESAEALAEDLGRFLAGEPVWARPMSAWERGWRWLQRHPALVPSLLSLTAVLLVLLGAYGLSVAGAGPWQEGLRWLRRPALLPSLLGVAAVLLLTPDSEACFRVAALRLAGTKDQTAA